MKVDSQEVHDAFSDFVCVPVFVGVICDPGFYAVHYGVFVFHYDTAFLAARFSADRWSQ